MSQNSISQHPPACSPLCTHTVYAAEQTTNCAAAGVHGNPGHEAKGRWETQQLCPQMGTRTSLSLPGRRGACVVARANLCQVPAEMGTRCSLQRGKFMEAWEDQPSECSHDAKVRWA